MKLKSSLFFAKSLIFPRTDKKSTARKSIISSILCIGLSFVPLIIVLTMTNSMISGMTERIIEISSSHLSVLLKRASDFNSSYKNFCEFAEKFENISGVKSVKKEIDCEALAVTQKFRTGCQVRAVEFEKFFKNQKISSLLEITSGKIDFENVNKKTAVIGSEIAQKLNLSPGDNFRIVLTKKSQNQTVIPKIVNLTVSAVVSSGYKEIDSLWIFVPVEENFENFSRESSVFSVLIETPDAFSSDLGVICANVAKKARPNAVAYTWKQMNQWRFENFQSTKIMLYFVMILIVLVTAINISSALVMLVMERKKEIAILKSLGATKNSIAFSFVVTGGFCGLCGVLLGLPFGILCSINLNEIILFFEKVVNFFVQFLNSFLGSKVSAEYVHLLDPDFYLSRIPIQIPIFEILLSSFFMILLAVVVSLLPSIKAGKQNILSIFNGN